MSKCEACGGDGQIEYGAYRGEEAGPTRECRLCGGVMTDYPTGVAQVQFIPGSAASASEALTKLAHASSKAGWTIINGIKQRQWTPDEIAAEHLEQLRQENERRQIEAEHDIKYEGWLGEASGPGR